MFTKSKTFINSLVFASAALFVGLSTADEGTLQLAQTSDGFNAEQKYMASCFACHSTGAANAPKVEAGVYADQWAERMEKGMDAVMQNVINGMGAMPAKGLCFDCTDADLRALVDYMVESSQS
ncbi:MAG: c-type cytochrome [Pseudohongiellaceae bacterium]